MGIINVCHAKRDSPSCLERPKEPTSPEEDPATGCGHGGATSEYSENDNGLLCVLYCREPVWLNIYDLMIMNYTLDRIGMGVYHTGVEVYGRG